MAPRKTNTTFVAGEEVVVKATGLKGKILAPTSRVNTYAVELSNGLVCTYTNTQLVSALDKEFEAARAKVKTNLATAHKLLEEAESLLSDTGMNLRNFEEFTGVEDLVGEMGGHGWSSSSMNC